MDAQKVLLYVVHHADADARCRTAEALVPLTCSPIGTQYERGRHVCLLLRRSISPHPMSLGADVLFPALSAL